MSEVFVFLARASAAKLPRSMRGAMRGKIAATVRGALCGVLRGKTAALGLFSRAVEFVNSAAVVFVR